MSEKDKILEGVEVYISYGRTKEAVKLLQEGIEKYPLNNDLKVRLHEILDMEVVGYSDKIKHPEITVFIHVVVFYLIIIIPFLSLAFLDGKCFNYVVRSVSSPYASVVAFILIMLSVAIYTILCLFISCFSWFKYVEYSSANKLLNEIEKKLPMYKFEPLYGFVKKRFYKRKNT